MSSPHSHSSLKGTPALLAVSELIRVRQSRNERTLHKHHPKVKAINSIPPIVRAPLEQPASRAPDADD